MRQDASEWLKRVTRKFPFFYHMLQESYYGLRSFLEIHFLGTRLQEWKWRKEYGCKDANSPQKYWESSAHPHRLLLIEKIVSHAPLETVLEVGCNTGPNLYLLSDRCKEARLFGIDINAMAIKEGRIFMKSSGITNVFLEAGKADSLDKFSDSSVDVVFSDAMMMYIGPDKIKHIISHMLRIARKAVILNEWNMDRDSTSRRSPHFYYYGHWIHDYFTIMQLCGAKGEIGITKIPQEAWNDKNWQKYGAIIEVKYSF